MGLYTPTIDSFKAQFTRGFNYGTEPWQVMDSDITAAIAEASAVINENIYPPTVGDADSPGVLAELYLTAHFVITDIDAANTGGQTRALQSARSVDGVSESLDYPDWMKQNEFAFYATTYYGQKFLLLTKPFLDGAVFAVRGATHP